MKQNNFSVMPSVSISRSKFKRFSQHKTTCNIGEIVPIYCDEVLPGDTRKIDLGSLIRMSTPIAPIMDNIYADVYSFFVPNRLTWSHWKEFMGENTSGAGIYSGSEYTVPQVAIFKTGDTTYNVAAGTLGHHLGLPVIQNGVAEVKVSALPIRGYQLIYNRFFRDQNLIAPITVNTGDLATSSDNYNVACYKAAKKSDYFTRSLPYAQKGNPVSIPLGKTAPLYMFDTELHPSVTSDGFLGFDLDPDTADTPSRVVPRKFNSDDAQDYDDYQYGSVYADLSKATAATINELRFAFQYQKLLEKDALYGTRYWEIIKSHFGVVSPDSSLQDPELLGHRKININVDQVIQTTGIDQATPAQNELGSTAAVSVTGDAGNILSKSFTEHGYLYILIVFRHDQTYSQGVDRMFSRTTRTDFYFPVFANLGAQKVLNKEIFAGTANDEKTFGFQEAWAEYRYKPSKATGLLDPSVSNSLGYWTLTNNFASLPTLSQSFIEQTNSNLQRVLSTGSTGPDFICDFAFNDIAVRPMPMYSIPGLIDHH